MSIQDDIAKGNRAILLSNIERDPIGSRLTPGAKQRALDFAVKAFKGDMGNGQAAELGIKHVMADVMIE